MAERVNVIRDMLGVRGSEASTQERPTGSWVERSGAQEFGAKESRPRAISLKVIVETKGSI